MRFTEREFYRIVGDAIRVARQRRGWTQATLAEESHLSVNYVSRLERGEIGMSLFYAVRIAAALGITVREMMARGPR